MIKQQRWAAIIDLCRENTSISVAELVPLLRVSEATVRRDLQQMEDLNMVSRYHGGVRLNDGQSEEPPMLTNRKLTFQVRIRSHAWLQA